MKTRLLLVTLLLASQLYGCSQFYAHRDNLNEQIDSWLVENEYGKIESTLKYLSTSHPDYQKIKDRKPALTAARKAYIENVTSKADKLVADQQWQQAIDLYTEAQAKVPDDPTLIKRKTSLIDERDSQVKELRKDMMLRRGRALVQYQSIYQKLEKLIPDDYGARYDINRYHKEKQDVAAELMEYGEYSLDSRNYVLAEECIDLSNSLAPSAEKKKMLANIVRTRKNIDDKRRSNELLEAYEKAYDSGDFAKAGSHLETLLKLDSNNKQARELKTKLDRDIKRRVESGIERGKTLYSLGKINEALSIWEGLLKIDPKNEELASLITRGKKVSTKIKTLEKTSNN
jgi:tetratricopeptide (TPR) repeat protein